MYFPLTFSVFWENKLFSVVPIYHYFADHWHYYVVNWCMAINLCRKSDSKQNSFAVACRFRCYHPPAQGSLPEDHGAPRVQGSPVGRDQRWRCSHPTPAQSYRHHQRPQRRPGPHGVGARSHGSRQILDFSRHTPTPSHILKQSQKRCARFSPKWCNGHWKWRRKEEKFGWEYFSIERNGYQWGWRVWRLWGDSAQWTGRERRQYKSFATLACLDVLSRDIA